MNKWNIIIIIILLIFSGCRRNPLKVDISSIDVEIEITRLDRDLFRISSPDKDFVSLLKAKYGSFFDLYSENILGLGKPDDSLYSDFLQQFITDSVRIQSKSRVDSIFSDLSDLEEKLCKAFRYYTYHFPDKKIPKVYTVISGFNQSMITTPDALGISLDNYLGSEFRFYRMLGLPEYKKMNMIPEKIPTDAMYAWAISEFETGYNDDNLLCAMISQGKLMYFLDAVFPDEPDYLKIGYKPEQIAWCEENENAMWTYLIENKLLFDNERMNIRRFTGPGPFTSAFSNESPGRTGTWIGWQIVRRYMEKNRGVNLLTLMNERDCQKILNESKYDAQ